MVIMQKEAKAVIIDLDGTLCEGRVATGIGKAYMRRELARLHFGNLRRGIKGAERVMEVVKTNGANGNAEGLKAFYDELIALGLGKRYEMFNYATKYLRKHRVEAVAAFINRFKPPVVKIIATTGGSTSAEAAQLEYGAESVVANIDQFKGEDATLRGVRLDIRNGDDKLIGVLDKLDMMGIKIGECIAIGDGQDDVAVLNAVPLNRRYASPLADEKVLSISGIVRLSN